MLPFLRHDDDIYTENQKSLRTGDYYRVEDVTMHKDAQGRPELLTRSGGALEAPAAFHDPTASAEPAPAPGSVPVPALPVARTWQ